jgi:hypothetical protein
MVLPLYFNSRPVSHEGPFFRGFRQMTNTKQMLHSCIYHCVHTLNNLKSSLNVQTFVSAEQILAFFAQIEKLFAKRYSHLETAARYPVVEMSPKPKLTEDQRKQTLSRMSAREQFQKMVCTSCYVEMT